MSLEQFTNSLKENPLEFQLEVEGEKYWFKSDGDLVPESDGGKFEDGIVDIYMTHTFEGRVSAIAQVDISDSTLWDYEITNNELTEDASRHFAKA